MKIHLGKFYLTGKEIQPIPTAISKGTKRRMFAKDYPNEQTYMKAISKALFSYMKWAKEKGKL